MSLSSQRIRLQLGEEEEMAKYHTNPEISDVIEYAISLGWTAVKGTGHCYCTLRCPVGHRSGCQYRVFSTPKNAGQHSRWLKLRINSCKCETREEGKEE